MAQTNQKRIQQLQWQVMNIQQKWSGSCLKRVFVHAKFTPLYKQKT